MPTQMREQLSLEGCAANSTDHSFWQRLTVWLGVVVIAAAGWWCYAPAMHGEWIWDDRPEVSENPLLSDPHGLTKIWLGSEGNDYFPLKSTVQWVQWRCWGNQPTGYHGTNLGLHLLSALLIWRLLLQLGVRGAWWGGLLFALHPLTVESVAWVAELKNALSLPPLLMAAIFYLDYDERGQPSRYWAALLAFLVAALCKTSVVMFPVVVLIYGWWKRAALRRQDLLAVVPFFLISLVLGCLTMWLQQARAVIGWDVPMGGLSARVAMAGLAFGFYLKKIVWPVGFLPVYPRLPPVSGLITMLPWVALVAALWWCWCKRTTCGRHLLLGFGWFFLNLLPVVGFAKMSYLHISWVADHFVYLPLVGIAGLVAAGLGQVAMRLGPRGKVVGLIALVLVCGALALQSRRQAALFVDEGQFWRYTVERNPTAWLALNNLGYVLLGQNRAQDAVPYFEQAVRLKPDYGEAHNNLILALVGAGQLDAAIRAANVATQRGLICIEADVNLGVALLRAGRPAEAIWYSERALRLRPEHAGALRNLANCFALTGRAVEALPLYAHAMRLWPDAETYSNWGALLQELGRLTEAIQRYEQALQLQPDFFDAHFNLALALVRVGRLTDAKIHFDVAVRLRPEHVELHYNIGDWWWRSGDPARAAEEFAHALKLNPDFKPALQRLQSLRLSR